MSLVIALTYNLRMRKKAEVMLKQNEEILKNLTGRLILSQEEILHSISRELHDDLSQRLAIIAIEIGVLESKCQNICTSPDVVKMITIKQQLIRVSSDFHILSRQIHPSILDDLGLVRAAESECSSFSERTQISIHFSATDIPNSVPSDIALCLYRVLQESLRNIANHAKVHEAIVILHYDGSYISLTVKDEGIGFELSRNREKPGIGIASMRERVEYMQGEFNVISGMGKGTIIRTSIPFKDD